MLFCCLFLIPWLAQQPCWFKSYFATHVFVLVQGLTSSADGVSLLRGNETPPPSLESQSSSDLQLHASSSSGMSLGPPPSYEVSSRVLFLYCYSHSSVYIDSKGIYANVPSITQCYESSIPAHRRGTGENSQTYGSHPAPPYRNLWWLQEEQRVGQLF